MRFSYIFLALVATSFNANPARAQEYPNKLVRIITSEPGGPSDIIARIVAQGISESLGQSVIVDNRTGIIAAEAAAKSPPDGYTLLFYGPTLWLMPYLRTSVAWDPVKDFSPVIWATRSPNILVIHPSIPAKSVSELIALAKAKPGTMNFSTGATGSSNQLAAELFKSMAGINILRVPYKGTSPAVNAVVGGQVQLMFPDVGVALPIVKSGRLTALAVTSAAPSPLAPGIPTIAASGLPGYESEALFGMFAPAKTPVAIINRLNEEAAKVLSRPAVKEKFFSVGVEPVAGTPVEFANKLKVEMSKWGKVIKDAGIHED